MHMYKSTFTYTHTHTHTHTHTYIYIYIERERESERGDDRYSENHSVFFNLHTREHLQCENNSF